LQEQEQEQEQETGKEMPIRPFAKNSPGTVQFRRKLRLSITVHYTCLDRKSQRLESQD
jgi:hypothetical protein